MHGHKYSAGDRVYRTVGSPNIPKGAKGTVGDGRIGRLFPGTLRQWAYLVLLK
ncbi:hypothetical protein vBAbaPPMK34_14 [Acinetobacter phage vB_AbaP_PMK34]|uniref:Uncharacterized protein n=1 Tax=Acinetobacter phage vB_AbaP_PMK34 TaxID=2653640 RepID=A0A6M3A372_9CAUD|nr:hypothetical protein vBAbaPPMK34_14 [Acinetobacter phage vB_AbaP_PMK34]